MSSDTQPFLSKETAFSDICDDDDIDISEIPIAHPKRPLSLAVITHVIILALYTAIFVYALAHYSPKRSSVIPGTLPGLKLEHEAHVQTFDDTSYSGPPSSDLDSNWASLMSTMRIRVSNTELSRLEQSSVPLPESGNLVWLGVYHQLHCVVCPPSHSLGVLFTFADHWKQLLRQYVYFEYYFPPNITSDDMYHFRSHADHCLEVLRQGVMCAGDTSLTTMNWEPGKKHPGVDLNGRPKQQCARWDTLISSIEDRVVGMEEYEALLNPLV